MASIIPEDGWFIFYDPLARRYFVQDEQYASPNPEVKRVAGPFTREDAQRKANEMKNKMEPDESVERIVTGLIEAEEPAARVWYDDARGLDATAYEKVLQEG